MAKTETVTLTTKELEKLAGIEYSMAHNLLKFLVLKGIAQESGVRPNPAGKGKGSNLYTVPKGALTFVLLPN